MEADTAGSRGLPHQGDVGGVAPEGGDVILDPLHRHQLVEHSRITRNIFGVKIQESKRCHSVLDTNTWKIIYIYYQS